MRTENVYIDIRSLFLLCESGGLIDYSVNPALKTLFSALQQKNSEVHYAFTVFGRYYEFNMVEQEYVVFNANKKKSFSHIVEKFNQLKNTSIVPLQEADFFVLDANLTTLPELFGYIKPLFVSSDPVLIAAAQNKQYVICKTYLGGELNPTDLENLNAACRCQTVTSVLLSSDIDSTLLLVEKTCQLQTTVLNGDLIALFHRLHATHSNKQFKFMLLTARSISESEFALNLSYRLLLDDMQALFLSFFGQQNALFLTSLLLALGDSRPNFQYQLLPTIGIAACNTIFSQDLFFKQSPKQLQNSFQKKKNPLFFLPTVKQQALTLMPFISVLPVVCTANPYAKSGCLKQLKKPEQLMVHFDDSIEVIHDIRAKTPDVCVVQIYTAGAFPSTLLEIITSWLSVNVSPVSYANSDEFDELFHAGSFHSIHSLDEIAEEKGSEERSEKVALSH